MTYRELLNHLMLLNDAQLDSVLLVELGPEDEILEGEFRVVGENHDELNENHPVIFVP